MRLLGDKYVREEFKLHAGIKNPKTIQSFINEWTQYHSHMQQRVDSESFGKNMSAEELELLDDAQKEKLKELKESTVFK